MENDIIPSQAVYLPQISFDEKQLPEIKKWEVGKKYKINLEVELIGLSKDEYKINTPLRGSFKIFKVDDKKLISEEQLMAQHGRC